MSLLCDRDNTDYNKVLIVFINFVCKLIFEIIVNIIPECNNYLFNIKQNLYYYENQIKEEKMIFMILLMIIIFLMIVKMTINYIYILIFYFNYFIFLGVLNLF